ncbi:MAG: peptidoglycan recognition family protein [Paenisporosarcina sp.]
MAYITRETIFPGQLPSNNDGSRRNKLSSNRPYYTIHYTGANANFADFNDSISEVRGIQAYAVSPSKRTPWEYNYAVDTQGNLLEYAGEYQAAHSGGENDEAYGVILLLGINDYPTEAMVDTVRFLRSRLLGQGALSPSHKMLQHNQMPGAETTCPGPKVIAIWDEFIVPFEAEEIEVPLSEEDVQRIAKAVWSHRIAGDTDAENKTASWRLRQVNGIVRKFLGPYKETQEVKDPTLLRQIHDNTKPSSA